MSTSRYFFTSKTGNRYINTTTVTTDIFRAVDSGQIPSNLYQIGSAERLDHIAFKSYGDGTLWWIIAAASGIGWPTQLAAGTYVRIPSDLNAVYQIMRGR